MEVLIATAVLGLGVSYGDFYLFHFVLGVIWLRSLIRPGVTTLCSPARGCSQYHELFGYMFLWLACGLVWSWDRFYTIQYLGYVGIGASLSVAIVKYVQTDSARFERLFSVARTFFLIDVIIGVLEALTPFRPPVSPFSKYSSHYGKLAYESLETMQHLDSSPTGFHWNPNNYAVVMNLLLPFVILHKNFRVRVVGAAVLGGLIFATGSRGSLAAMAFMICLAPLFGRRPAWFVRSCMLIVVGVYLAPQIFQENFITSSSKVAEAAGTVEALKNYVFSDGDSDQNSVGARRQLMQNGLNALQQTHYLGVGAGADKAVQEQLYTGNRLLTSMHNFWVELLVGGGAPFFLVFIIWYGRLTYELFRHSRRLPAGSPLGYYASAASLALVGFIPGAVSASSVIYVLPMYILFGLSIAVANLCRQAARTGAGNSSTRSALT